MACALQSEDPKRVLGVSALDLVTYRSTGTCVDEEEMITADFGVSNSLYLGVFESVEGRDISQV
jgi:hypothetical protein